jgi:hypothetical protein
MSDITHRDIRLAKDLLIVRRRDKMRELMDPYDRDVYYPEIQELTRRCGEIGHKFQFSHLGPLGDPWFRCSACDKAYCDTSGVDEGERLQIEE